MSEAVLGEILDRLLELNYARYAEECARGLHEKKRSANRRRSHSEAGAPAGTFFEESAHA